MKRFWVLLLAALFVAIASPSLAQFPPIDRIRIVPSVLRPTGAIASKLPVYNVAGVAGSPESAKRLAAELKLPGEIRAVNGAIRFLSPEGFQRIPTKPAENIEGKDEGGQQTVAEAIDFDALKQLTVLDEKIAIDRARQAFEKSELVLNQPRFSVSNAELAVLDKQGGTIAQAKLDTEVNVSQSLGNVPLVGPGAKTKISFNSDGSVSQLLYAQRVLQRGQSVAVISSSEAQKIALSNYRRQNPNGELKLTSQLVYYAPSLDLSSVKQIVPQYLVGGTANIGGQQVQLRQTLVAAVPELTPKVNIEASSSGAKVSAKAAVSGGVAPYTYQWQSSSTSLDEGTASAGESIEYTVTRREGDREVPEVLSLTVTDANGVSTTAVSQNLPVAGVETEYRDYVAAKSTSRVDVGTEWVGNSQGLGGSSANVAGFVNRFQSAGIPTQFNYGEYAAWERDFKDPAFSGSDDKYVDDVDMTFYTGHGNPTGFTFSGNRDDGFLANTEARWGQNDLEWLALATCLVLNADDGNQQVVNRWGNAFQGLHTLLSYSTISGDNTREGAIFSEYMLRNPFLWWNQPMKIREAWAQTAIDVQPSSVVYSMLGVVGRNGVSSYNDYFWGKGNVSPDLRGSDITAFWIIRANC